MMRGRLQRGSFSISTGNIIGHVGAALLIWTVAEAIYLYATGAPTLARPRYVVGLLTVAPTCLGMIYASWWLRGSEIPADRYSKVKAYWAIGGGGFLAFNAALITFFSTDSIWIVLSWLRWALTFGLGIGLVIGIAQVRAIVSALTAEREAIRAEHVKRQRDLIDRMNGILRHEVLNSAQVIIGNASVLMDAEEPIEPTDERIERIHRHGEEISTVIQEVRVLLNTIEENRELTAVNLTDVIRDEIRKVRDQYPGVDIELRCEGDSHVLADELLGRVFANLFRNAVEHNDPASLRITVDVEQVDDAVVVTIEDDGSGIPEHKLGTLFERPRVSDHGLGLYLVKELTNSYDGTVELLRTGAEGTTFEVRFPKPDMSP